MATIGEILAAKGKKLPQIDDVIPDAPEKVDTGDTMEETPKTVAPPDDQSSAPSVDEGELAGLRKSMEAAGRDADADVMFRRASALASLGRQNPDQIDIRDIEARRNAPLQMYQQRQEARKAAAQQALEAAHARYFGAETAALPQREAREGRKLDADIADAQAKLAEAKRTHDQEAYDKEQERLTQLKVEGIRQAGENARFKPYAVSQNPMGLGPTMANEHTGEMSTSYDQNDPRLHDAIEQKQAGAMHVDKDLNASQTHLDNLTDVSNGLKTVKGWEPTTAEKVGGVIGGPAQVIAGRVSDVGRTPEAIQLRNKARMLLQEGLKEGGGVRAAASPQEMKMLQDVYGNPNATPKELKAAIDAQIQITQRHLAKVKGKLPINALAKPAAPAANTATPGVTKNVGGKEMYLDENGQVRVRGG